MPRDKSRYRDRRSSSYNSESSYERKKSKSKHKRRSRSRDRSESTTQKRRRSTSRSKHKRRSYSRSPSRDRYEKSRRRSSSRNRSRRTKRSDSRDRSRSSSQSRSKYSKIKKSRRRSRSSSSRSSSFDIERPLSSKINLDDTETKLEKAIKAAEAVGLTMTKIPTYEYKEVEIKEDMPTIHDRNLIAELNSDSFVQKSFVSSKNKKQNIVIDLNSQTVKLPESEIRVEIDDTIINLDEIPSEEELREMWIKKLLQYRKKMLKGEI